LSTTARNLLLRAQENGVSTTLKIYSPPIGPNCGSQATSPKPRPTTHKSSTILEIDLSPMGAAIETHELRVTSHKSRNFDEL
jgi:hypothetical protein